MNANKHLEAVKDYIRYLERTCKELKDELDGYKRMQEESAIADEIEDRMAGLEAEINKLRKENRMLEKEREMLWKTVDRMEKEYRERDRIKIDSVVTQNGNLFVLKTRDMKTGEIGYIGGQIGKDGKLVGQ